MCVRPANTIHTRVSHTRWHVLRRNAIAAVFRMSRDGFRYDPDVQRCSPSERACRARARAGSGSNGGTARERRINELIGEDKERYS